MFYGREYFFVQKQTKIFLLSLNPFGDIQVIVQLYILFQNVMQHFHDFCLALSKHLVALPMFLIVFWAIDQYLLTISPQLIQTKKDMIISPLKNSFSSLQLNDKNNPKSAQETVKSKPLGRQSIEDWYGYLHR